jgi:hypothetical protein
MARSKEATKRAKAAYSRRYRKSARGKAITRAYNRRTIDERASRNKARALMVKKHGKAKLRGKEIHHKSSNPKNNTAKNLAIAKKGHGGGVKNNQNARKKRKRR